MSLDSDMLTYKPLIDLAPTAGLTNGVEGLNKDLNKFQLEESSGSSQIARFANYTPKRSNTLDSAKSDSSNRLNLSSDEASHSSESKFQPRPGYAAWYVRHSTQCLIPSLVPGKRGQVFFWTRCSCCDQMFLLDLDFLLMRSLTLREQC